MSQNCDKSINLCVEVTLNVFWVTDIDEFESALTFVRSNAAFKACSDANLVVSICALSGIDGKILAKGYTKPWVVAMNDLSFVIAAPPEAPVLS